MPTPTKVTLTGGAFQDSEGNLLNSGYLEFQLNQDANIPGVGNIAAGIVVRVDLGADGSVKSSPAQKVWGNDQMLPINSYYRVTGYTALGQPAWGPNNQQVNGDGTTFDIGTWIPNQVISWTPTLIKGPELETNGVPNSTQDLLNLIGAGGTTVAESGGTVTITSGDALVLENDGVLNSSQALLNLVSGDNFTFSEDSPGAISGNARPFPVTDENSNPISSGQVLIVATPPAQPSHDGGTMANVTWRTPAAAVSGGLPDPSTAQYSLWTPNNITGDNTFFTPSSIWGTRVLAGSQSSPSFYTNIDNIGNWTTPVAIARSQASPDAFMGYSENILVNNTTTSKLQAAGNAWIYPGRAGKFKAVEMASGGVLRFRHWIGIFDQFADISILEPAAAAAAVAGAMFFFNHADSANLQCFTSDRSGAFNLVDSGIPFTTSAVLKLEIDWDGAGTYVFKVNSVTVATISTHTPTAGLGSNMSMMYALASNGVGTGHGTRTAMLYGENSY